MITQSFRLLLTSLLFLTTLACQPKDQAPLLTAEERLWLAEHGTELTIAPDYSYAPIEYINEDGDFRGIAADYVRLLEQKLGCKFSILKIKDWNENVKKAKNQEFAIWSAVAPTPQKQEYMLFSRPYLELLAAIIVHNDETGAITLDTFGDRALAVVDGYFTHDYLKRNYPGIRVVPVKNAGAGLQAVAFKNVDAMLIDLATASPLIEQQGLSTLKVAGTMDLGYSLAFASRKDWPTLNRILDAGLASITPEERQTIYKRWVHYEPTGLAAHRNLIIAALTFIALLCTILGGIFLWNLSLRRLVAARTRDISEQKALLQSIFKSTPDGIGLLERDVFTWTNQRLTELSGYSSTELLGTSPRLFYADESDFQNAQKMQATQLQREGMSAQETRWLHKDGSTISILLSASWLDPTSEAAGVTITALDITSRKLTEKALEKALRQTEEEREKTKAIIAALGDGISLQDTNFKILYQNDIHKGFIGDHEGETCYQAYEARDTVCDGCPVTKSFQDGAIHNAERSVVMPEETRTFDITASPLRNAKGEIIAGIELVRDITSRKQAEQALAAEKELLAVTLRSIGDGVITTDISGRIVLLNKVAEELTGWSQAEAAGRALTKVFRIINEGTRQTVANPVDKVLESGQIIGLANHTALISKDGTERSIADSGAPIRDSNSQIIGVVVVFRDVSAQNRLEQELIKLKKLESIGILAGGIAHDFNNILMAILGNLNLASQLLPAETKAHTLICDAEKASLRAKDLTLQLLTFSKGGNPIKETASIAEIIKDSAEFVLRGSKTACIYHFPPDLWLVEIDKGQISQVIQNLIINANHAMPDGGTIEINGKNLAGITDAPLVLLPDRKYVQITVHDTGIGIPPLLLDKIFDPYFTTKEQGSGLGLAIAHGIISKHDGAITVASLPGQGTTFTIYLPASERSAPPEKKSAQVASQGPFTIMIMDDDEMVRKVTKNMLQFFGHRVILAKDGEEAIALYRATLGAAETVDAIFMDLTIPGGMGGKEAVREILKINPEAKVIVSSGYSNDPIMANYRDHGFCAAMVKPYQMEGLIKVLHSILS